MTQVYSRFKDLEKLLLKKQINENHMHFKRYWVFVTTYEEHEHHVPHFEIGHRVPYLKILSKDRVIHILYKLVALEFLENVLKLFDATLFS